jgi:translocation and assembly module TamB
MNDDDAPAPAPVPTPRIRTLATGPGARWRRAARMAGIAGAAAIFAAAAALVATALAWRTEAGTRWLLRQLPGVTVVDVHGALGGGDLRIGSLHTVQAAAQVDIVGLRVQGLALRVHPHPGQWLGVRIADWEAQAVRVQVTPGTKEGGPAAPPRSLRSPVALDVAHLHVGSLAIGDNPPLRDVEAAVALGADAGRAHRVEGLRFGWERVQAAGSLRAQTDAPMEVEVALDAHDTVDPTAPEEHPASAPPGPPALPHWSAHASLRGPLDTLALAASLRGEAGAGPGRPAPRVDLAARVTPFASLPLTDITLHTDELDLSALSARAPATRLTGDLHLSATRPAALDARLRNLAPRPWSDNGLPFSELEAKLEAPWNGASITVPALRLALHDGRAPAGELRAQGRWAGPDAQVQLELDQVQLARLDERLGAWRLSGPLHAEFEHLPTPNSLWGGPAAAPAQAGTASVPDSAAAPASAPLPPQATAIAHAASAIVTAAPPASAPAWSAHLGGRIVGAAPPLAPGSQAVVPPPLTLDLDTLVRADAADIKTFALKAGGASASLKATARRTAAGDWQGEAHLLWAQFDPGAWWRLADSGPLRTGPNLLTGKLDLELARAPAAWQGVAALRARAEATLAASQIAGVPIEGKASLDALSAPWKLVADLRSGDNQAHAEGALQPAAAAQGLLEAIDSVRLAVDAPAVASLAPLAPGRWPTHGTARFEVRLDGALAHLDALGAGSRANDAAAHPLTLVTQGDLADWSGPQVRLDHLHWEGQASTDPQAPLTGRLLVQEAIWGTTHVVVARADLSGTLADHTLRLRGVAPVSPPEWLANLAGIGSFPSTRIDTQIEGRWRPGATDGPELQEHVAQLELRASTRLSAAAGAASAALAAVATAEPPTSGPPPLAPLARPLPPAPSAAAAAAGASVPLLAQAAASAPASAASSARRLREAWLHVDPFDLGATRDAAGHWQRFTLGAGRIDFAGLVLTWQPSSWTAPPAPGASPRWSFDAALANFYFAQVMARAEPDMGWHGDLQLNARIHAAFDGRWHLDAEVARGGGDLAVVKDVATPGGATQSLGLTTAHLHVTADGAHWHAETEVAGTRLGELAGRWSIEAPSPASLPGADSALAGNLRVNVADLNVWGTWLPPGWRLGGRMQADLRLAGRVGGPDITGRLTAQGLEVRNALEGVYARDGVVDIGLEGDHAEIRTFRLEGGNGELTLAGGAELGAKPVARLDFDARQFQLLGRIDRRLVTTGTASVRLTADTLHVEGKLGIDEGLFDLTRGNAPTLDADVDVKAPSAASTAGGEAGDEGEPAPPTKAARATTIALGVDLGDKLRLKGHGIDTLLRGALQITAPGGRLAVRGTISTAQGTYKAYGQNLEVARGVLTFTGPVDDPRLDILATRPNLDIVVGVLITGTALAPHVKLYSEPEMADSDKLSWLMLGRASEGSADTALLQQAAIALLAGGDSPPDDTLFKQLGLTDLSFRQQEDQNNPNAKETVVTVGRQLSRRVYVGYERGVSQTTGNWQLIYRVAQRWTIRAQSGEDNALDVIWTWRWN